MSEPSTTAFDRITSALESAGFTPKIEHNGTSARSRCPVHQGESPTGLSITKIAGRALIHCFAGCDDGDVLDALGLAVRDLYDNPRGEKYDYYSADFSDITRTVHRTPDKKFKQSGRTKDTPTLYRLPEVLEAVKAGRPIWLVEGEKDVHALETLGVVATTAPMGAGNFGKADVTPLSRAVVHAVVDKDDAGDKWAAAVTKALTGRVRALDFYHAADGKDAADHIAARLELTDFVPYAPPPADDETGPASWDDIDLTKYLDGTYEPVEPTLMARSDGVCLIYRGLTHSFHGESESGKSLLMQYEAAQRIRDQEHVLFVDFESDEAAIVARLRMFGATAEQILGYFHYKHPEVHPRSSEDETAAWQAMLNKQYVLAIIDGVTDSLAVFGYDTKDNDDVTQWARALPKQIAARTGAAVAVVDHVTKDGDSRGRFAIGGQAKLAGLTGAGYTVEVSKPLGRGLAGEIVVRVGKDRPGHIRGRSGRMRIADRTQETARITVDSTGDPDHPVVTVGGPRDTNADGDVKPFRPTMLMERVSEHLEAQTEPVSWNKIKRNTKGNEDSKRTAIDRLIAERFVTVEAGPRDSQLHTSVKPYRQTEDPESDRFIVWSQSDDVTGLKALTTDSRHTPTGGSQSVGPTLGVSQESVGVSGVGRGENGQKTLDGQECAEPESNPHRDDIAATSPFNDSTIAAEYGTKE